uniref:Uncharacterized protein n=1 Tax=Candidatus Kentrum sp. DK TaxID=2126562 RepID=A0A450SQT7_9GAMM|nr:MAG: hypothetical protein BECKDK2373B_GA0170837_10581 [Candidatus Kentron sp. DK]
MSLNEPVACAPLPRPWGQDAKRTASATGRIDCQTKITRQFPYLTGYILEITSYITNLTREIRKITRDILRITGYFRDITGEIVEIMRCFTKFTREF